MIGTWEPSRSLSVNVQAAKGFRLGGINDPLNVPLCTDQDLLVFAGITQRPPPGSGLPPSSLWQDETAWNYEVGTKASLMGGRASFNASAFYMDISDLQLTVTAGSCSSRLIYNVPATSQGAELEFAAAPNPNFDFAASATVLPGGGMYTHRTELISSSLPCPSSALSNLSLVPFITTFSTTKADPEGVTMTSCVRAIGSDSPLPRICSTTIPADSAIGSPLMPCTSTRHWAALDRPLLRSASRVARRCSGSGR